MTQTRFLQLHTLTSYSGVLLNRDDVGFAKRLPFGGLVRTRVSSQCLKRHWRCFDGDGSLRGIEGADMSVRSRRTFDEFVFKPLHASGVADAVARAVTDELQALVLGTATKKPAKAGAEDGSAQVEEGGGESHTGQITVLGRPEMKYLLEVAQELVERCEGSAKKAKEVVKRMGRDRLANLKAIGPDGRANPNAIRRSAGLDAALFGRMVTGDVLARCDAAIHVAHAFTVHGEEAENDYFSAVDDLLAEAGGELGSGHIGSNELTSGLFYGYVVVDVPLLVSNLEGCKAAEWRSADRTLAAEVVRRFVRVVSTVTPGAKLGSTAPYSYASFVGIESGDAQPRTFANAFLEPVRSDAGMLGGAYRALAAHAKDLDAMYGADGVRRFAGLEPVDALGGAVGVQSNLTDLATWASDQVRA